MSRRREFIAALPGLAALAALPGAGPTATASGRRILGAWSGAVSSSGGTLKVLTRVPGVPVAVTLAAEGATVAQQSQTTDGDGVVSFRFTGLQESTRYRFALRAPGDPGLEGQFRTFASGPFSFRVLFASCAATGSASPVFTAMQQQQPDLFVHMGDLHYEDIGRNEVWRFRDAYHRVHASQTQSALFRSVPLAYTWDDHDFGPNDSDRTSPSRAAALAAYRRFVPHYPLAAGADAAIHQAFTLGRVRFLLTDVRSARSPRGAAESERTMLGERQLDWLERELEGALSAPLVVWVNTVPWITKRDERTRHGWAPYARERRRIADQIARLGLTGRLVMLSGDAHMLALDDGSHSQYSTRKDAPKRGFVVAHAAPMDRWPTRKGGPYSRPPVAKNGQYGVMDVADDGGRVRVTLQGMRGSRKVPGMELEIEV